MTIRKISLVCVNPELHPPGCICVRERELGRAHISRDDQRRAYTPPTDESSGLSDDYADDTHEVES